MAWASYRDGQDPATVHHDDVHDIEGYPEAPIGKLTATQAPTQSLYQISDDRKTFTVEHGWNAANGSNVDRLRRGLIRRFKPREKYPETSLSWSYIPDNERESVNDPARSCAWLQAHGDTLAYLKRDCAIEHDEDVETNFFKWAFKIFKSSKNGPFEAGANKVSPQSKITIVVGCPVKYDRQTRESLKRIVARAAGEARLGNSVAASYGIVVDAEAAVYEVESAYKDDLTNVYLVTEPGAALLYFLAKQLSPKQCEELNGATVILGDIGGGTSDYAAFEVRHVNRRSFRCKRVSEPIGDSCGSYSLNENLEKISLRKLEPLREDLERYNHGIPLKRLIEVNILDHFERMIKPGKDWNTLVNLNIAMNFRFLGLYQERHQSYGCTGDGEFTITGQETLNEVFLPWLERNSDLLGTVLQKVQGVHHRAARIALIGGGASQPALQPFLEEAVMEFSGPVYKFLEHHVVQHHGQYVARGLVLAAADRANAPPQKALANYAVLEDIPYDENEDEVSQNGSKKWKNKDTGDMEARGIPHWIIRENEIIDQNYTFTDVRSDYTFWGCKNAWALEATIVAKTGEAPELYQITHEKNKGKLLILHTVVTELDLIDYLDHRVIARVQVDIKPLLAKKVRGTLRPRCVKGQQRKCQQHTVQTIIRQHIRGPDLVLTWVWLGNWEDGPEGQPGSYSGGEIQLAEQVVNMAASFDIEDVEIQFADAPEEPGDQMLHMPGPSSAPSSTIAPRAVFEQPTTDRSRKRASSKMTSNEPRDSSPRVSRRRRPESKAGHPSC